MRSGRASHLLLTAGMLLAAFLACRLPAASAAQGQDVLINGGFELDANNDGWPDGWPRSRGASIAREGANAWLVQEGNGGVTQVIRLDPDWGRLKVTCRMRVTNVQMGQEGWQDARLAMSFVDAKGAHVDPWPDVFHAQGSGDWVSYEREYRVPSGAAALQLGPGMLGASGKVEFDDIHVSVVRLRSAARQDVPPPAGAGNLWNMATAWRQKSLMRERICLNDLWRFLPLGQPAGERVPGTNDGWGWFKVPGIWPRTSSGEAQNVLLSDFAEEQSDIGRCDQAWYKREITVPADWRGRRVLVDFTVVQTHARVFLDGEAAGEIWFPGGPLEITKQAKPGMKQELAVLVTARPTESESQVFMAPDRIIKSQARIDLRGLTGDVFLASEPAGDSLGDVHVVTSVRGKSITLDTAVHVAGQGPFRLLGTVFEAGKPVKRLQSAPFRSADVRDGRLSFSAPWPDAKRWDLDTPQNVYDVVVTLRDARGRLVDETLPERFGFREFSIRGRDFVLNGKPVHLRALFLRNMSQGADKASVAGSRRTLQRMREYGFNFFITSNYHFKPGAVGYMEGLLDAADQSGMLCSFSLPHVRDFRLNPGKPETAAAYRKLTEYLIRRVQNHPSVILYAMNHNATGYYGDQNPLKIDGLYTPDSPVNKGQAKAGVRQEAQMAAAIAKEIDPTRPVYHHQSGNLGDMYTVNIYLNWAPKQERSDWLEHWGTAGTKPLFFVEWGLPHISSWSSFRGPAFIWRTEAYQSVWDSEYAAPYIGQEAYRMTDTKVKSLEHEESLWAKGKPFPWSTLIRFLGAQEENYKGIQALFASDNWPAHRTWGISAMLPWDQEGLWRQIPGRSDKAVEVAAPFEGLQKPGIVPDRLMPSSQYLEANDVAVTEPTVLGRTFRRWNLPLCAYIGGGPQRFTEKGHNFTAGETARKQLVVLNDTRRDVTCAWSWSLSPGTDSGSGRVTVKPGEKAFVPIAVPLAKAGKQVLRAKFGFGAAGVQTDSLDLHVLPAPAAAAPRSSVALYDPKGETARVLDSLGIRYRKVEASALPAEGTLVIGREALSLDGPALDLSRVRDGLKVLLFEQSYDVLVQRFGFRANIHGERNAFVRASGHPALEGLADENLRDWRGAATLVPPHLTTGEHETSDPKWNWLGFTNTHVWRCGNNGNVASVLIEKPSRGRWLPLVDCSFDLQYTPLLECSEGKGRVLFCQLDVSGRTEEDPAAKRLCANLVRYLDAAPAPEYRPVAYAGDDRGAALLERLGVRFVPYAGGALDAGGVLVLGPGAPAVPGLDAALQAGLRVLALGLNAAELQKALAGVVKATDQPMVSSLVGSFAIPELAGISNADLHWRTRPTIAALEKGAGEGSDALRVIEKGQGRLILCQAAPWMFDYAAKPYLRTTYRRNVYLVSRLLANLGAPAEAPASARVGAPAELCDWPLPQTWKGQADQEDRGEAQGWTRPGFDDGAWKPIAVPGTFESQVPELANYDGVFWYRIRFTVPRGISHDGLRLEIGAVDDESWAWLNGQPLGEVTAKTHPDNYWSTPRVYAMNPGMLREGAENVLVVRVRDLRQSGGILGTPRLVAKGPWLRSYYLQDPESVDDPYRYYRW